MEGSNVLPIVGEGKVGAAQYADNGAVLYQGQGDTYGSIQHVTDQVPPVIMADQSAQNQDFLNGSQELFSQQSAQHVYSQGDHVHTAATGNIVNASSAPQISADFEPVPVSEPTIVPEKYTPLEGGDHVENKQLDAGTEAAVEVVSETIKSGEQVTNVSVVESSSAGKEKSMSPPILEEEKEVGENEENPDEDAPVIEVEAPAKEARGRGRRGRQSSGKSDEGEEKVTPRRGRTPKVSKSAEEIEEDEEKKQYPKRTRGSPGDTLGKAGKAGKNQVEELDEEEEEVENEEEETPVKKGRGRPKRSTEDTKPNPTPKGKGRGRGKKNPEEDVPEESLSPKKGRGRAKKVVKEEIEEEVEEIEEEFTPRRRGRPSKSATPVQKNTPKKGNIQQASVDEEGVEEEEEEEEEIEEEMEEEYENPLIERKRAEMFGIEYSSPAKKMRGEMEVTDVKEEIEDEEEVEEIEDDEDIDEEDEEYEQAVIRRAQQGTENDPYSFEEMDQVPQPSTSQQPQSVELKPVPATPVPAMKTFSTQTPIEAPELENFVEVVTFSESPGKRTVMTQTDPRLKKKRFGPLGLEGEEWDMDDTPRKRRFKDDGLGLFEDTENRRRSFKRNAEEALKCPFCDKAFIGLVKHIKTKHKDEPDFEEEMRNAKWRERIMKVSTMGENEEGEACPECGKMSKNLKRHMELHQQNRMQIPCPICGKVVLKTGMSSHMRTVHSGRRPYKCPHCDYASAFRGNLNTHIKGMHLHTRQYLCNTCKAAFKTLGALIGHTKRVHEGWKSPNQKIFICSVCEKRFTKKYHVDRHMLIHTGERPHKCHDCGRCFNNKSNLMSHIQLVHKKLSPYQCDMCQETFKRKKKLLEHIGEIHVSAGESAQAIVRKYEIEYEDDEDDESFVKQEMDGDEEEGEGIQQLHGEDGQTYVTVSEGQYAAMVGEGQYQTIQAVQGQEGQETIIIVQTNDPSEVTQAIVNQGGTVQYAMQDEAGVQQEPVQPVQ
ncbi:zinc finger and SCAN domain-containing protein 21-like isoform X2 [Mercenaria mercenaria]|nr:zinc finger and SCAN domain-containing protein 21-like isoform X2 [Mercenaria mercenaria]